MFEPKHLLTEGVNVACFHGPVDGSTTYSKATFKNENFNHSYFSQFDMTLLGDIHLPNQSVGGYYEEIEIDEEDLEEYTKQGWEKV